MPDNPLVAGRRLVWRDGHGTCRHAQRADGSHGWPHSLHSLPQPRVLSHAHARCVAEAWRMQVLLGRLERQRSDVSFTGLALLLALHSRYADPKPTLFLAVQACNSRAATSSTAAPAGMCRQLPRQHLPLRAKPVLQRRPLRRQSQLLQQSMLPARRTPSSRHPQAAAQEAMPPRAADPAVRARRLMQRRLMPRLPRLSSERCLRAGRARGLPALTPIVQRCGPLAIPGGCCPRLQAPQHAGLTAAMARPAAASPCSVGKPLPYTFHLP